MPAKSRREYLALAEELISKPDFDKEDSARANALIAIAQMVPMSRGEARIRTQNLREELTPGQPTDAELRDFFAGKPQKGKHFAAEGGRIYLRTYTGLNEGTATAGGDVVPTGFHADVLAVMRAANGLFDAAT